MLASAASSSSAGTPPLRAPLYQRTGSAPIFKVSAGRVFEQRQELSRPEQSNHPPYLISMCQAGRGSSLSRTKAGHTPSSRRGSGRSSPKALVLPYGRQGLGSLSGQNKAGRPCFLEGALS